MKLQQDHMDVTFKNTQIDTAAQNWLPTYSGVIRRSSYSVIFFFQFGNIVNSQGELVMH